MSKQYIFLPTIQHTGTWFVIDILQHMGFKFTSLTHDNPIYCLEDYEEDSILHVHYPLSEDVIDCDIYKFFSYQSMSTTLNNICTDKKCMTIIPIKDVLASIITRYGRYPEGCHKYIIDGFLFLIRIIDKHYPFYFPVDLYDSYERRIRLLISLETYTDKIIPYKKSIAREWKPKNSIGIYNLKEAYYEGNYDFIKQTIPLECEYLIKNREELQLFFERLGYKDLLWYG